MKQFMAIVMLLVLYSCKEATQQNLEESPNQNDVETLPNPTGENSSLPRLYHGGANLYLNWVQKVDTLNYLQLNLFDGVEWLPTDTIISGTDWFMNWADFPQFCENNGYLLNSYLKKSAHGTYTYDIHLNHFNPETQVWKKNFPLHKDETESEHGFVSMQPYGKNGFFVSWLDGRNTSSNHNHSNQGNGAMTLRGAFIDVNGDIMEDMELDPRVCDCCNTASTVTPNAVLVAYRNRTEEEIRDIAIIRYENGHWEEGPTLGNDHWKIPGCPVNGPAIDSHDYSVSVAWFTAANDIPQVQIVFSEDEGKSFGLPIRVDTGNAIGRLDIEMISSTEAIVSWMEPDEIDAVIRIRKVTSDGTLGQPITIAKISAERASGFPQMELFYNRLYFTYTLNEKGSSEIKMASVSLEAL